MSAPPQIDWAPILAARAQNDRDAMKLYAASLSGLIGVFTVFHISTYLGRKTGLARGPFRYSASIKSLLSKEVPIAPSLGHVLLYIIYLGLNLGFFFVKIDDSILALDYVLAARAGWLGVSNLCLTVFLSLKNTPLGFLTGWTYDRLNSLHRASGLMTAALIVIHAAMISAFYQDTNPSKLAEVKQHFAVLAGFTLWSMVAVALALQRRRYELFYVLHVLLFVALVVFVCLHHPDITQKVMIVIFVAAGLWIFDRLVRATRLLYHSINNTATLQPLPSGGTRVIMQKGPSGARSGQHAYLWIPGVRYFETHPFTIVSTQPLEFVIDAHDGFTRDLHEYAVKNPGVALKASFHGPYGHMPDATAYDKILIFAGGSGGTFGFGMALQLLRDLDAAVHRDITVVWVTRSRDLLEWFSPYLEKIARAQGFNISVNITGTTELNEKAASDQAPPTLKRAVSEDRVEMADSPSQSDAIQQDLILGIPIHHGRPDVDRIVSQTLEGVSANSRVLVLGCGPSGLLQDVRQSATSRMVTNGAGISLQFEQFGW
ncbi:ferric reductase like transmembrane component [Fusarium sp. NRRL 52700]|nr:ferric reductase like transmembrane component [Fusarium sp. NRRL 52700]